MERVLRAGMARAPAGSRRAAGLSRLGLRSYRCNSGTHLQAGPGAAAGAAAAGRPGQTLAGSVYRLGRRHGATVT